jgi:hypothetical protein
MKMAKPRGIADAEWEVTVRLLVSGEQIGEWTGKYADSYAALCPENVGSLMVARLRAGIEQSRKKKGKK